MPIFKKCWCLKLRNGNIIIAWIGLVISIGYLIYSIGLYSTYSDMKLKDDNLNNSNIVIRRNLKYSMGISVVGIFINATLFYGALKSIKLMLLPWLVVMLLGNVSFAMYVLFFWKLFFDVYTFTTMSGAIFLFGGMLIVGLLMCIWLYVLSYYQTIKQEEVSSLHRQNAEAVMQIFPSTSAETPPPEYNELQRIYNF